MNTPYIHNPPGGDGQGAGRTAGTGTGTGTGSEQTGETSDSLAQQARERGHERIDSARQAGADSIERIADGVREAASQLEQDESVGNLSQHFARLADGMTRVASGLREKSGDDLVREVGRLARENPTVFVAGSVALGFALTRFGRASARRRQDDTGGGDDETFRYGAGAVGATGEAGAGVRDGSTNTVGSAGASSLAGAYGDSTVSGTGTDYGLGGTTVSGTGTDYGAGGSTVSGTDASFGTGSGHDVSSGVGASTDERGGPSV